VQRKFERQRRTRSNGSINTLLILLTAILKSARRRGLIDTNPVEDIERLPTPAQEGPVRHGVGRAARQKATSAAVARGEDAGGGCSAPTYLCACQPPRRLHMAPTVYALAEVLCVR